MCTTYLTILGKGPLTKKKVTRHTPVGAVDPIVDYSTVQNTLYVAPRNLVVFSTVG